MNNQNKMNRTLNNFNNSNSHILNKFQKDNSINQFTVDRELDLNLEKRKVDFPTIKDNSRY